MSRFVIFVHRPEEGYEETDTVNMKVVECQECPWFTSYVEELWTSNSMPDSQRLAWREIGAHARAGHRSLARIVRGWKP